MSLYSKLTLKTNLYGPILVYGSHKLGSLSQTLERRTVTGLPAPTSRAQTIGMTYFLISLFSPLSLSVSSSISLANNNMISAALRQFCHHTFRVYCLLLARWLKYDTSHISIRNSYIMCCILGSEGDLLLLGDEYV